MAEQVGKTVAIVGNPNSGKTSLFNILTGSNQKTGNFPGVTVERKTGILKLAEDLRVRLVDLPGSYSLYPNSADERIATEILINPGHTDHPDLIVYVASAKHLDRQLLLLSQMLDLGFPTILVLSMIDEVEQEGRTIDTAALTKRLGIPVMAISSRRGKGLKQLKDQIGISLQSGPLQRARPIYELHEDAIKVLKAVGQVEPSENLYLRWLWVQHFEWVPFDTGKSVEEWLAIHKQFNIEPLKEQVDETFERLNQMELLADAVVSRDPASRTFSEKIDALLTHWFWGPTIFAVIMLFVFQAIFAWATYPMDAIESAFGYLGSTVSASLPEAWYSNLITEGVLPGLSGVLIFIPQIAILFFLISILEEVGYMSRAVYLFDHWMQRFGMNGRSIVALISGGACAIPAIMSTRTIANWKERLITILVTPFISCSARIPVYAVLIAFVVPYERVGGIFNTQGLAFAGLYLFGIVAAFVAAYVFKKILKGKSHSFFVMELPAYRMPDWMNVWRNVKEKVGAFVMEAGKIILIISMILWFLASYGPGQNMHLAEQEALVEAADLNLAADATEDLVNAKKLESSFAGILGKSFEPIVEPLGYDWKIGIALITAFAAREVFVGSMATIYSIGSEEDEFRIREHLAKQVDPVTREPVFDYPTALSLLLFFVLAMQCMSTLAVVKKETNTWKWPIIQFGFMTVSAYVVSLIAFQLFS